MHGTGDERRAARHSPAPSSQVNEGLVLAVGPGRRGKDGDVVPVSVKEGDKVLLPEYGGSMVKLGGPDNKEVFLYRDEELLGVLTD
ncbi:hypothetical protein QJQ45_017843 [Haematococcus lacustris]|nr:hypothetical protein QJQ45_017843 [Haematococcus lacustris]